MVVLVVIAAILFDVLIFVILSNIAIGKDVAPIVTLFL